MLNLNPTLTAAGLALFAGQSPGFNVRITDMAFGAQKYDPIGTETALRAELARYPVDGSAVITASTIQVGVLMKNNAPDGKSPNNNWIGEIGFYVGNTLFAVLSRAQSNLFYKTPDIDIPVTYVLDFSVLPPGSITVNNDALAENIALSASYAKTAAETSLASLATIKASYYGTFATGPTVRPDNSPRQKGDRYFDSTLNAELTWNGSAWYVPNIDASTVGAQLALKAPIPSALKNGTHSKRITIIGSSVPFGDGAQNYNGYAQRLAAALVPYGYLTTNVSIGGDTTNAVVGRFYRDVPSTAPDIVIIALSLGNEGLATSSNKEATYQGFIDRMFKLADMCRQLGYKVAFTGVYPHGDYTEVDYQYVRQANQELENSDIPYFAIGNAVDNYKGKWRAGMWRDPGHPNDIGHEAMFRAIPLSMFDRFPMAAVRMPEITPSYIYTLSGDIQAVPLSYVPESPFGSVTVMANVRRPAGLSPGRAILTLQTTAGPLRIRNVTDAWGLALLGNDDLFSSTRNSSDNLRVNLAIRSDYYTNTHTLFIDGVSVGVVTLDVGTIGSVTFGGRLDSPGSNASGYEFDSFVIWRTGLTDEQVAEAANGRISKGSLCLYSPAVDGFAQKGSRLVNLAPSRTALTVGTSGITATLKSSAEKRLAALEMVTPRMTWVPAFTAPDVVYAFDQETPLGVSGTYSRIGDRVFFDLTISWNSAPANTPMNILMPVPCTAPAIFTDFRITNNTAPVGDDVYAFINLDGTKTITFARKPPIGVNPIVVTLNTAGGNIRFSGNYPA